MKKWWVARKAEPMSIACSGKPQALRNEGQRQVLFRAGAGKSASQKWDVTADLITPLRKPENLLHRNSA